VRVYIVKSHTKGNVCVVKNSEDIVCRETKAVTSQKLSNTISCVSVMIINENNFPLSKEFKAVRGQRME
jgi:hypothetical protein